MSKMIQMKESTAKREVKQEYGLTGNGWPGFLGSGEPGDR